MMFEIYTDNNRFRNIISDVDSQPTVRGIHCAFYLAGTVLMT